MGSKNKDGCIYSEEERKALVSSYLGKTVRIKIDRPIGYVHKKPGKTLVYPINYGYIPGVLGAKSSTFICLVWMNLWKNLRAE